MPLLSFALHCHPFYALHYSCQKFLLPLFSWQTANTLVLQRTYALRWRNGLRHALYLSIVYLHYLHLSSSHTNTKPEPFSVYSKLLFLMRLARCEESALPPYISLCLSARENPDYRE